MKITVDTNVLVRAVLRDDKRQTAAAMKVLKEADVIAVSLPSLCELVWILRRGAGLTRAQVAMALRTLINVRNVVVNRPAVEAGLAVHDADGDFADGVIAYEGDWLGGETFVSFDKEAVRLVSAQGRSALLLK